MWDQAADQIKSIHAMLDSGHRSVRMESHTLAVWGIAGAALILVMRFIFPPENFSEQWLRTLVVNSTSIIVLAMVAIWDVRLTRRRREARDETVSFTQKQLTKVWWSIVAMIILLNIGMSFFGGGYLFFATLLSLLGLAFYIHGLFSQQVLAWAGGLMILMGLLSIALRLPIVTQEWLTVMVLGIGLPSLGYLIQHSAVNRNLVLRIGGFMVWVTLIITPALAVDHYQRNITVPNVPLLSLAELRDYNGPPDQLNIVHLPAGSVIPIQVMVNGSVFAGDSHGVVPLHLSKGMDVVVQGNRPTGWYRVEGEQWHDKRYNYHVQKLDVSATLTREQGPSVNLSVFISTEG